MSGPQRVAARWASQEGILGTTRSGKPIIAKPYTFQEWIRAHDGWTRQDHYDAVDALFAARDAVQPPHLGGSIRNGYLRRFYDKMGAAHQYGLGGHYGGTAEVMGGAELPEGKERARSPLADASKAWRQGEAVTPRS